MKSIYSKLIQLLFPAARAFYFFIDSTLNKTIFAVSVLVEYTCVWFQKIYMDFFPQNTRFLATWEKAFGVDLGVLSPESRRKIVSVFWKKNYGTAEFIQSVLRMIVPSINVVENVPIANPSEISLEPEIISVAVCGNQAMCCGNKQALCGFQAYVIEYEELLLENDRLGTAVIPQNSAYWESCFYVCGNVERGENKEILSINFFVCEAKYKQILEILILRIKQAHTRAVMFVHWV